MNLFEKYIGIPFVDRGDTLDGADCYGLVRLIYKQELGISIPEFNSSCDDTKKIFSDYLKQIAEHWEFIPENRNKFDVIAMAYDAQHPRIVQHFGVYVGNGIMLQTLKGIGSFITKVSEYEYHVKGTYRWKLLP